MHNVLLRVSAFQSCKKATGMRVLPVRKGERFLQLCCLPKPLMNASNRFGIDCINRWLNFFSWLISLPVIDHQPPDSHSPGRIFVN